MLRIQSRTLSISQHYYIIKLILRRTVLRLDIFSPRPLVDDKFFVYISNIINVVYKNCAYLQSLYSRTDWIRSQITDPRIWARMCTKNLTDPDHCFKPHLSVEFLHKNFSLFTLPLLWNELDYFKFQNCKTTFRTGLIAKKTTRRKWNIKNYISDCNGVR